MFLAIVHLAGALDVSLADLALHLDCALSGSRLITGLVSQSPDKTSAVVREVSRHLKVNPGIDGVGSFPKQTSARGPALSPTNIWPSGFYSTSLMERTLVCDMHVKLARLRRWGHCGARACGTGFRHIAALRY